MGENKVRLTGDRDWSRGDSILFKEPWASRSIPRDTHPRPRLQASPRTPQGCTTDTGLNPLLPTEWHLHTPRLHPQTPGYPSTPGCTTADPQGSPGYPEALGGKVSIGMGGAGRGDPGKGTPLPSLSNPPTLPHTTRTHTPQTPGLHSPHSAPP